MFRKTTGLVWSWIKTGPSGFVRGLFIGAAVVKVFGSSKSSWTSVPFSLTVMRGQAVRLPSSSNFAAVKYTSYVCHARGGRHMLSRGFEIE